MNVSRLLPLVLPAALLAACAGPSDLDIEAVDGDHVTSGKIYYGDAPDSAHQYATVSLHTVFGSRVIKSPFCSGTLIAEDVVLTAGHCVETWGGGVIATNKMAVYVGENPFSDLSSHTYTVSEIEQHSGYNSMSLTDDIALIRLDSAVTEVTPVPYLPASDGLSNSDVGATLNFAGFGETETGGYGKLLQVDQTLRTVYAESFYYLQSSGGPCAGDSGGPAYIERSGTWYVAGVTSYGDYACTSYGVSTRVDAYASWIDGFVGTSSGGGEDPDPGTSGDCSSFDSSYSGFLSGTGDYAVEPGGTYYTTTSNGAHEAQLISDGADFDLYLYRYRAGAWRNVDFSEGTGTSDESISYSGRAGSYLLVVSSYDGSGDYELCLTTP